MHNITVNAEFYPLHTDTESTAAADMQCVLRESPLIFSNHDRSRLRCFRRGLLGIRPLLTE
jgi:hypothetical protein